ncbi:Monofunctional biosynthetic peptidoglycan transglycosylase [uncultured delta proteobacterium]|uniref:Biosynthetic peptidoglycan transglycosylase n=1 Tax=uncultured delta proteobacterium TaxID=34034 RepID=A0A212IXC4_9DELT|nr:Monofunctional biosynthetic peptidoglycan transglycosylase [uncultured delta proteobacterium]
MRLPAFSRPRPRTVVLAVLALFCLNILRYAVWPPVGGLAQNNPETTAFIEYRQEEWEKKGRKKTVSRTWKPLRSISPELRKAVVVSEDSTFWSHPGFDFAGMREAMERNIARGRLAAGGSTITQQLAKNLYFSPGKSFIRKLQEALVAMRLEMNLPKERILELYLNCVEWGDGIFGAEAAARHYFGVSASRLTAYQSATLAAMLPSPLKLSPSSRYVRKQAGTIQARMRIE